MSKHIVSLVYRKKIGSMMRKAVFSYMADRANDDGTGIWSSKGTISNEIEASRQGVINTIKGLLEDGLLIEIGPRKCANGFTMEYSIDLKKVHALPFVTGKKVDTSKSGHVNEIDGAPSTTFTPPVNLVDTNLPEPSLEPSIKCETHFDDAWNLYGSCKLKARQTKKLAKAQWSKAVKKADADTILKAIRREVEDRKDPKGFIPNLPDMHRWLRDERWQDVEAVTPEQPKSLEDWKQAAADYCELGVWPVTLGPPPHQPGCKAPVGLLKTIAKRMQEHSWHDAITQNIGEAA